MPAEPDLSRPRVFGIGLNKTGTTSLHAALGALGFESLHWGGPAVRGKVVAAFQEGRPLLDRLDPRYDAFSDIEVLSKNFPILDAQYPGSRFILTVRAVDAWIDSRRRHVEENRRRRAAGEYRGSFLTVDEPAWRAEWDHHVGRARRYFADRPDLLEIDITGDAGWAPLCTFLDRPEPDLPFPWENPDRSTAGDPAPP